MWSLIIEALARVGSMLAGFCYINPHEEPEEND